MLEPHARTCVLLPRGAAQERKEKELLLLLRLKEDMEQEARAEEVQKQRRQEKARKAREGAFFSACRWQRRERLLTKIRRVSKRGAKCALEP